MARLLNVFHCPVCPRGSGVIAIDAEQVVRHLADDGQFLNIDLRTSLPQHILRIKDGAAPGKPCRHIVSLLLEARALAQPPRARTERRFEFAANYDHPWYKENDPDTDVSIALWCEMDDDELLHGTRLRHRVYRHHVDRHWLLETPSPTLEVSGTVYVAVEPEEFLSELKTTWNRVSQVDGAM